MSVYESDDYSVEAREHHSDIAERNHPELVIDGYEYVYSGPDFLCSNCQRPRSEHPDGWGPDLWRAWRHEFRSTGVTA